VQAVRQHVWLGAGDLHPRSAGDQCGKPGGRLHRSSWWVVNNRHPNTKQYAGMQYLRTGGPRVTCIALAPGTCCAPVCRAHGPRHRVHDGATAAPSTAVLFVTEGSSMGTCLKDIPSVSRGTKGSSGVSFSAWGGELRKVLRAVPRGGECKDEPMSAADVQGWLCRLLQYFCRSTSAAAAPAALRK
jgi:hypothetical protein